jgi:hypothetical protein
MKSTFRYKSCIVLLLLNLYFSLSGVAVESTNAAGQSDAMLAELKTLDALWQTGQRDAFIAKVQNLKQGIRTGQSGDASLQASSELLEYILEKEAELTNSQSAALTEMKELALYIADNDRKGNGKRAEVLSRYLGLIRNQRISNFEPLQATPNVAPPAGVPGFAGMNPDNIADPKLRSEYKEAIRKNDAIIQTNKKQLLLSDIEVQVSTPIVDYLARTAREPGVAKTAVDEWIQTAALNDIEKKQVRSVPAKD